MRRVAAFVMIGILGAVPTGCVKTERITANENEIAFEANNARRVDRAGERAQNHCEQYGKSAVLDRVDEVGKRGIAYFRCE